MPTGIITTSVSDRYAKTQEMISFLQSMSGDIDEAPMHGWDSDKAQRVCDALNLKVLNITTFQCFVHAAILKAGRRSFRQHIRSLNTSGCVIYPERTLSSSSFAYTLANCGFSQKEKDKIVYEHGESECGFVAIYLITCLDEVVQKLLDIDTLRRNEIAILNILREADYFY